MTNQLDIPDNMCECHEDREIKFFCLSKMCEKNPKMCILCLKNEHKKCENDFIVKKKEFLKRIQIEETDIRISSSSKHKIKQIIQECYNRSREEIKNLIKKKKREINQNNILKKIDFENLTPEQIRYIKKNKILERDKETGLIFAKNLISLSEQNLDLSLKCYKKLFESNLNNFYGKILKTKIIFEELTLKPKNFLLHEELTTKMNEEGIIIKREGGSNSTVYCTAIYNKPLKKGLFEVKILKRLSNNLYDCFLNCGFITENKKESIEKSLILPFNGNDIFSYHGYNHTNLKGNYSLGKKDFLENKNSVFLEIDESINTIRVFNENETLDLKKEDIPDGNYYFFVTMKYNNTSCTLRKIFV